MRAWTALGVIVKEPFFSRELAKAADKLNEAIEQLLSKREALDRRWDEMLAQPRRRGPRRPGHRIPGCRGQPVRTHTAPRDRATLAPGPDRFPRKSTGRAHRGGRARQGIDRADPGRDSAPSWRGRATRPGREAAKPILPASSPCFGCATRGFGRPSSRPTPSNRGQGTIRLWTQTKLQSKRQVRKSASSVNALRTLSEPLPTNEAANADDRGSMPPWRGGPRGWVQVCRDARRIPRLTPPVFALRGNRRGSSGTFARGGGSGVAPSRR